MYQQFQSESRANPPQIYAQVHSTPFVTIIFTPIQLLPISSLKSSLSNKNISVNYINRIAKSTQHAKQEGITLFSSATMKKIIEHYSFNLNDKIGKGFSAIVYKGKDNNNNNDIAIKVIEMKLIESDEVYKKLLNNQIEILRSLSSQPHILQLYDSYSSVNNTYIMTELCDTDLAKQIREKKRFPLLEAVQVIEQILAGYLEINKAGFIHRDLKPANVFVRAGKYKIADFGFAIPLSQLGAHKGYNVGSPIYMPPEALKLNSYNFTTDLWAIGVMLFEMLKGSTPWNARSENSLYQKMIAEPIDILLGEIPEQVRQFLSKTLKIDAKERPNPEQAKSWLTYFRTLITKIEGRSRNSVMNRDNSVALRELNPAAMMNMPQTNKRGASPSPLKDKAFAFPSQNSNYVTHHLQQNLVAKPAVAVVTAQQLIGNSRESSNTPHAQASNNSWTNSEMKVKSLLNYCKFIYRVLQLINSPLKYNFPSATSIQNVLSNVLNMKVRKLCDQFEQPSSNPLVIENWDAFLQAPAFQTLKGKANKCYKKYSMLYPINDSSTYEWEDTIKKGIHELMDYLENPLNFDEKSVLIGDYLTTLYQLFDLDRRYDWSKFPSLSKIDMIVDVNPYSATVEHLNRLKNKIAVVGI